MIRNVFTGLSLCATLAGCGDANRTPGGNSGTEGSTLPCETTARTIESVDAVSGSVGVSAASLLELANRQPEVSLRWQTLDAGPAIGAYATHARLQIAAMGPLVERVCDDPEYPEKHRPKPRAELPVAISLRSDDGALDERIETVLISESPERAQTDQITLELDAVGGDVGRAVAQFYTAGTRTLVFQVEFGPDGSNGGVLGPFSPHAARPCAYTTYATWGANAACWDHGGEPTDDTGEMQMHLARVDRRFELQWSDRPGATEATVDVELAEGTACRSHDQLSHPVRARIRTADGRVDITLPARLSGGPSDIDPWPANLKDVEPFSLSLSAAHAVDADVLRERLGVESPATTAAIVSFYIGSPSGVQSPLLSGGFRVAPIDRSGFASPLPTVELPGGDSEHCFSAAFAGGPLLRGELEGN